jgi:hypothetical protein
VIFEEKSAGNSPTKVKFSSPGTATFSELHALSERLRKLGHKSARINFALIRYVIPDYSRLLGKYKF